MEEGGTDRQSEEERDNNGREMALVELPRRGIARHRSVARVRGSDGTDSRCLSVTFKKVTR